MIERLVERIRHTFWGAKNKMPWWRERSFVETDNLLLSIPFLQSWTHEPVETAAVKDSEKQVILSQELLPEAPKGTCQEHSAQV